MSQLGASCGYRAHSFGLENHYASVNTYDASSLVFSQNIILINTADERVRSMHVPHPPWVSEYLYFEEK